MLKYRFECTDEAFTRGKFQDLMDRDRPWGKGIWGNDLYGPGVHFTECGKRIKGYYLDQPEAGPGRGVPTRVSFRGSFAAKGDKTVFQVSIYPDSLHSFFLVFACFFLVFLADLVSFLLAVVVFMIFSFGFCSDIRKTAEQLEKMVCSGRGAG